MLHRFEILFEILSALELSRMALSGCPVTFLRMLIGNYNDIIP